MANFIITTVASAINNKKNTILNTFKNNPFYEFFDKEESWKKDKISARLNDLTVQKSAYNEVIPTVYGTVRLAGNIIWATDIKEVKKEYTTSYSTGKGGKKVSQNNIEYYYYANLAIAICFGEVNEISRVWADTDLINLTSYNHRIYYGTEEQEADPLIQSIQGINKTPAYKGLCYIVFENLPLAEFGNRIPNFTFEVSRNFKSENDLENIIRGVNIIPGCGEFVYDTEIISKLHGLFWLNRWEYLGTQSRINQNNNENITDSVLSIKQLKEKLPNCKWVAPVAVWFADSLNISNCSIEPRVEFKYDLEYPTIMTSPEDWCVAGITRERAKLISTDKNGGVRYGGTISDKSIVRYLAYLKSQGYKIMFYPMIFMDLENKPWRGYLTGQAEDVENFFIKEKGYNQFILHYANLVKDCCDAFIIGSEFRDLTKIFIEKSDENNAIHRNYPAIQCLKNLANQVRSVVGSNVKIGYASDWSEYHHTDGGWYNMDDLWSDNNIDFVGIDAYFPLTDKKETLITKEDIKNGWTSGEGYDWIYSDSERSIKETIDEKYAWKNIKWWWENHHVNPNGETTSWIPKSKKIWFTEYGFASVDGTSNEPNRFYDPECVDGGFPRFSEGKINNFSQRKAIQATEEVWANSNMVEEKFLWCWDARPFPYFPNNLSVWSDGKIWHYGHWLNGKLGSLMFVNMINNLFKDAEINLELIGDVNIYDSINGIVLNDIISVNEVLSILQKVFFFDYYEKDGKIFIQSKNSESIAEIFENDLLPLENNVYFKTNIIGENELPYKIDLSFLNKNFNYEVGHTYAERTSVNTNKKENINLPIVINHFKATEIAEKTLYSMWLEKTIYEFKLPIKYIYLTPSDVIVLNINDIKLNLRITNIKINEDNTVNIKAVKCDTSLYNFQKNNESFEEMKIVLPTSKTNVNIFELPAINKVHTDINKPEIFFTTNAIEKGWSGCGIYETKTGSGNFKIINESRDNSIIGVCLNKLENAKPYCFDYKNELYIVFNDNINLNVLQSVEMFDLLDGENLALVGEEIIQFKKIELQENGSFKISEILRGQYNTEKYISEHKASENFIFLNKGLVKQQYSESNLENSYDYKIISFKDSFDNSVNKTFKLTGKNLKPLNVCHIKILELLDNNYKIVWNYRLKGDNNWKDGEEKKENKKFLLLIKDSNNTITRSVIIENSTEFIYTNEMIENDNINNWNVEITEI